MAPMLSLNLKSNVIVSFLMFILMFITIIFWKIIIVCKINFLNISILTLIEYSYTLFFLEINTDNQLWR